MLKVAQFSVGPAGLVAVVPAGAERHGITVDTTVAGCSRRTDLVAAGAGGLGPGRRAAPVESAAGSDEPSGVRLSKPQGEWSTPNLEWKFPGIGLSLYHS